ncbi:hypothetical protein BUALT_Bualt03G0111600 [Buddleja alternifolia]|uniref:Uncharacterized protein n=1 Tax=Buddleja alternifolia TaxID=168488 RepID=A0AAV6XTZ6_9LAMI|nr:hypothetical protein BUALT_Bualt03G0111600 [Buddleja alternifolia]
MPSRTAATSIHQIAPPPFPSPDSHSHRITTAQLNHHHLLLCKIMPPPHPSSNLCLFSYNRNTTAPPLCKFTRPLPTTTLPSPLSANPERSSKQDAANEKCGLTVMKFMKPRSLWTALKVRKIQFHRQEKQEMQLMYKNNCKVLTLQDWIESSLDFDQTNYNNVNGGDMLVPKQSSRRIHPSLGGNLEKEFLPKYVDKTEEAENGELEKSSFCRTKSGKMKKKVSFRSPEVADIFLLDSPEIKMTQMNDQILI